MSDLPSHEPRPQPDRKAQGEFLALFLEIEADVYRYVCALTPRPEEARDIVQETALALWENFDRYDRSRPFLPWALRFALNKVRQHAEKTGRFPLLLEDEALCELLHREQVEQGARLAERRQHLQQCLQKLPDEQAALVRGYYWELVNIDQLAAGAAASVEATYKRLQRIRLLLLECINRLERDGREAKG
jgi:RNA polymerase sigma-70 factor (ECF subfamily)